MGAAFPAAHADAVGGFEADIRTYMDVVTELGRGCGSTSWVAFISIATVWIAALFPDEAQHEVSRTIRMCVSWARSA